MFSKQLEQLKIERALAFFGPQKKQPDLKSSKIPLFVVKNQVLTGLGVAPKPEGIPASILNDQAPSANEQADELLQKISTGRLAWDDIETMPVEHILYLLEKQHSIKPLLEPISNIISPNTVKLPEKGNYWTAIDAYNKAIKSIENDIYRERPIFLKKLMAFKNDFSNTPFKVKEALERFSTKRPFCQNALSKQPITYNPIDIEEVIFPCFKNQGLLIQGSVKLPDFEKLNFETWCQRQNLPNSFLFAAIAREFKVSKQKVDLSFFTQIHADSIVQQLSKMSLFPFEYKEDGCYAISLIIKQMLLVLGIPAENIHTLTITSWVNEKHDLDLAIFHENKRIGFSYHVAPCIQVKDVYYVIDPALFKEKAVDPITWANEVRKDSVYNEPISLKKPVVIESKFPCVFRKHSLFLSPLTKDPYRLEINGKKQELLFTEAKDSSSIVNALIKLGCFGRRAERDVLEAKGQLEPIHVGLNT